MTDFDPKWPHGHVTRDGRKARVICADRKGPWPVIALITNRDDEEMGAFNSMGEPCYGTDFLLNAPEPKKRVTVDKWVVVGTDGCVAGFDKAPEVGMFGPATIHLTGEIEEGATIEVRLP